MTGHGLAQYSPLSRQPAQLNLLTLVACFALAGCAADDALRPDSPPERARIVRQVDLPLREQRPSSDGEVASKTFQARGLEGWLTANHSWRLRAEVGHGRLRCATYEIGIQFGSGDAACSAVSWQTAPAFGSRQIQCNAATRIHSGGGELDLQPGAFEGLNCVRVLVRCAGGAC